MPQTSEAEAFLSRVAQLPPGPAAFDALSNALQPSLDDEEELRKLFATDNTNDRLKDPHVGLVDVLDAPPTIRTTCSRVPKDEGDLVAKYVMPLSKERRRKDGAPAIVNSLDEFKTNWAIFTEGSLSQLLDWDHVVAAGGSVQACLNPVPVSAKVSKRALRKYFHTNTYPTSDVDLFLYGMTPEQAEAKIVAICAAVRDSVPWDVTCVRTKHSVSIHSQYPYRAVQIVLRLYSSPAEILAGFDVDAPCCAYDGQRVWASPRAIVAMMRQCNTVDMTRRSPSYEVRLAKYSVRNFEVYVPTLNREDIDPTIFERAINRIEGLARLLVIEKLIDADTRQRYLTNRRDLRGRPQTNTNRIRKRRYKGDLKNSMDIGGLEMNDYDTVSLHIPYGPDWDARRINKLIYQTDLGMNSPFNPKNKNRRLHRHPAYFGTIEECLEDCCELCPEPKDAVEKALQDEEDKSYIRGRIEFVQEDPGRQSISGSFNPIDVGEWAAQAYIGPTEKLFRAIVTNDRSSVAAIIAQEGFELERCDHVGRTPLQVAVMSKAVDIAVDLIDAGARMTSRVVDGRTTLHLAAQLDLPVVVRKLLERSAVNAEKAKEEAEAERAKKAEKEAKGAEGAKMDVDLDETDGDEDEDDQHNSSEDDRASDGEVKSNEKIEEKATADGGEIPEDEKDEPDVFDLNAPDWDAALTALQYAVIYGSVSVVDELITAGADVKLVTHRTQGRDKLYLHQLTAVLLTEKQDVAVEITQKLIAAGAVSSEADDNFFTIFHKFVRAHRPDLVSALLRYDTNAKVVINTPYARHWGRTIVPIVSAIGAQDYATLAVLLAYDAPLVLTEADFTRANDWNAHHADNWRHYFPMPVETAIGNYDEVVHFLIAAGAEVNILTVESSGHPRSVLDWVRWALKMATTYLECSGIDDPKRRAFVANAQSSVGQEVTPETPGWKGEYGRVLLKLQEIKEMQSLSPATPASEPRTTEEKANAWMAEVKDFLVAAEKSLVDHGASAKGQDKSTDDPGKLVDTGNNPANPSKNSFYLGYQRMSSRRSTDPAPLHLTESYDELFEACWVGDNARIQELCLPKLDGKPGGKDTLLQITATFGDYCNPLSLAVQARRWDTARLVLAITTAQHHEKAPATVFQTRNIVLEDDDDDDDDDSDEDEDEDMEIEVMDFVDIAKRPSAIQSEVKPIDLLMREVPWFTKDEKNTFKGPIMWKAIMEGDLEAFVQIAELHKTLPEPQPLPPQTSMWILESDEPNMLDELIRRTGVGFNVDAVSEAENSQVETAHSNKSKTYLGLNVHGKKRKDIPLRLRNDPAAAPLLWEAAKAGAICVLKYLSGDRPLAAYQYYASTHSGTRARNIRRIPDLAAILPERLGWTINLLKESPLTAAIAGDKLEALQTLLAFQRPELQNALSARIKFLGFNHIQVLASSRQCSVEMFEFLRAAGLSVTEVDHRGWNIIHWTCFIGSDNHVQLLQHVLRILPEDALKTMMMQQSKHSMYTPLHIAVNCRRPDLVQMLLSVKASPFLLRDVNGCTLLHLAVKHSHVPVSLTELLLKACPGEALCMEDAVGNTPLEIITQRQLLYEISQASDPGVTVLSPFNRLESITQTKPFVLAKQEREIPQLRETIQALLKEGRLRNGTKLTTELLAFSDKMEARLAAEKVKAAEKAAKANRETTKPAEPMKNDVDISRMRNKLVEAIAKHPGAQARYLVHIFDVHRSVRKSLNGSKAVQKSNAEDDELAPEEQVDEKQDAKNKSFLAEDVFAADIEFLFRA